MKDILGYLPQNETETSAIRQWMERYGDQLLTRMPEGHFTAAGFIFNPDRTKTLMIYHNIYQSWSWMGGHADGDRDLLAVARREVMEESGLKELKLLSPEIFSLEILTVDGHIKRGQYVSSHLHLNVTYLFEADPAEPLRVKPDENSGVAWIPVSELPQKVTEAWFLERIYSKLCRKLLDTGL